MPNDLRSAVIKLAHAQPTLRKPLLAVLKEAADEPSSSLPTWVEPPSSLTAWIASEDQSSYTWSDGRTAFVIKPRNMRDVSYNYILLVASNKEFTNGDKILKRTFQHDGVKGRAKDWVGTAQAIYRVIQDAASYKVDWKGNVIFNALGPTDKGEVLKVGPRTTR